MGSPLSHAPLFCSQVDVDGAEWRAFEAAHRAYPRGLPIGQLQFESSGDDISGASQGRVASFFNTMFGNGFSLFHLETNSYTCWVDKNMAPSVEYAVSARCSHVVWGVAGKA